MGEAEPRLFFALWPDATTREALAARSRAVGTVLTGARAIPPENLHVTLRFIGRVAEPERVRAAAQRVRPRPMRLHFDRFGFWPEPQVAWLGMAEAPDPLLALVADLGTELGSEGFELRSRVYRPHITLYRGVRAAGELPQAEPLDWEPESFVLVSSTRNEQGSQYEIIETWPLCETAAG